jgi:hypothetical protein
MSLLRYENGVLHVSMSGFPKYPEGDSPVTLLHPVYLNWWGRIEPKA